MIPCRGQVPEQVEDIDISRAKASLFVISIFTGTRGWGHVAGGRSLLGSAGGSRTRAGLLVFLTGGDIKGLVLEALLALLLLDLGERGALGVVALKTFLHFAKALLEGGKFLSVSVDGSLLLGDLLVQVGEGVLDAEDVHQLGGERAGNGRLGATAAGLPVSIELGVGSVHAGSHY